MGFMIVMAVWSIIIGWYYTTIIGILQCIQKLQWGADSVSREIISGSFQKRIEFHYNFKPADLLTLYL